MVEDDLVAQFQSEMESIFERERELRLCSTRFIEGVRRYGGVSYARRLLEKAESDLPENTFTFLRKRDDSISQWSTSSFKIASVPYSRRRSERLLSGDSIMEIDSIGPRSVSPVTLREHILASMARPHTALREPRAI
jgi:hypothetical protein